MRIEGNYNNNQIIDVFKFNYMHFLKSIKKTVSLFFIPGLIFFQQKAYSQFSVSGSTVIQSGTHLSGLGTNIDAIASIQQGYQRVLDNGEGLNITGTFTDDTGEFFLTLENGFFRASDTGIATIGRRDIINSIPAYSNGGVMIIKSDVILSGQNLSNASTGILSFYDSNLIFYTLPMDQRVDQYISNLGGSSIKVIKQNTGASSVINLRIRGGSIIDDNIIEGVRQFEFDGTPASFARNKFINTSGFIAYGNGTLIRLENIDFYGTIDDIGITNNGGLYYIDTYKEGQELLNSDLILLEPGKFANLGIVANTNPALHGMHWGKSHNELFIDAAGIPISNDVIIWFKDNLSIPTIYIPTVTNGAYKETVKLKRTTSTGTAVPTYQNYYPIKKAIWSYLYQGYGEEFTSYDSFKGIGVAGIQSRLIISDFNISESNRATVNAYTTIDNLDQLYDRAKSWKVTTANIEYPTISTQPVTADGTVLDLGNRNLLVDASAGSAFAINAGTNTITIKSTAALVKGTKFSSIKTSGTVSTANGASLKFGYENPIGTINKYVALSNLSNTDTVLITDNIANTTLVNVTGITGDYKAHFIAPADASDLEVSVTRPNFSTFLENYPENDMSFVREINLQITQVVAESQIEVFNLVLKILQKEEAMYRALDLTNPTLNVNITTGPNTGTPSVENQLAILEILNKVFVKVIANRRKLE